MDKHTAWHDVLVGEYSSNNQKTAMNEDTFWTDELVEEFIARLLSYPSGGEVRKMLGFDKKADEFKKLKQEYIENNKPCLSLNDLFWLKESDYLRAKSIAKLKQLKTKL